MAYWKQSPLPLNIIEAVAPGDDGNARPLTMPRWTWGWDDGRPQETLQTHTNDHRRRDCLLSAYSRHPHNGDCQ